MTGELFIGTSLIQSLHVMEKNRIGDEERRLMHLVPAPAVRLMKRRVLSRPGPQQSSIFHVLHRPGLLVNLFLVPFGYIPEVVFGMRLSLYLFRGAYNFLSQVINTQHLASSYIPFSYFSYKCWIIIKRNTNFWISSLLIFAKN